LYFGHKIGESIRTLSQAARLRIRVWWSFEHILGNALMRPIPDVIVLFVIIGKFALLSTSRIGVSITCSFISLNYSEQINLTFQRLRSYFVKCPYVVRRKILSAVFGIHELVSFEFRSFQQSLISSFPM
jgi:hypothetical protein